MRQGICDRPTIRWTLELEVVNLTASPTEAYFEYYLAKTSPENAGNLLGKDLYDQPGYVVTLAIRLPTITAPANQTVGQTVELSNTMTNDNETSASGSLQKPWVRNNTGYRYHTFAASVGNLRIFYSRLPADRHRLLPAWQDMSASLKQGVRLAQRSR